MQTLLRLNWRKAKADDRSNWEAACSCLAMVSGGLVFARGYTWTLQVLAEEATSTNLSIGLVICSTAVSVSSLALAKLLFVCKTCKSYSKRKHPKNFLKTTGKAPEGCKDTLDHLFINPLEIRNGDLSANVNAALQVKTESPANLSEETQEKCRSLGLELKSLGDKLDATVSRLNSSLQSKECANTSDSIDNKNLCVNAAKELKRIIAEVGLAIVRILTPDNPKMNLSLADKNKKICKDIGILLKNAEIPAKLSCSPHTCFFCNKESRNHILEILIDHERYVEGIMRQGTSPDSSEPLPSAKEIAGAVLHKQMSAVLKDYERHYQLGSTDERNDNAVALYKLLEFILEDFRDIKHPYLVDVVVDNFLSPGDTISERVEAMEKVICGDKTKLQFMEKQFWERIAKTLENRDHNIQNGMVEQPDLAKRLQNKEDATPTSPSPVPFLQKWTEDNCDLGTCGSSIVDAYEENSRSDALSASKVPLFHEIDSLYLLQRDELSTSAVTEVTDIKQSCTSEMKPIEPKIEIPWPRFDDIEQGAITDCASQSSNIEEMVDLIMRGLDTSSLCKPGESEDFESSEAILDETSEISDI